jgi:hypothetical protein
MEPVLTVGKPCMTLDRQGGATDLIVRDTDGFIINNYDGKIAPVVHQFDRCGEWISTYFKSKPDRFM